MIDYSKLCIVRTVTEPRRGVRPAFTPYEVLKAIALIHGSVRGMGRPTLMKLLGLGEASTRTLLRRLTELGLIASRGYGYVVTELGKSVAELVSDYISTAENMPAEEVCSDCVVSGVIVRDPLSKEIRSMPVLAIRDAAVREGAKGALVIVSDESGLYLPLPGSERGDVPGTLRHALHQYMKEGDMAILSICERGSISSCMRTAFNAVLRLLTERCGS